MQPCFALADNELSIALPDSSKKRLAARYRTTRFREVGPFFMLLALQPNLKRR
jgi:hypothetical protein